jgi:hypothetical protein
MVRMDQGGELDTLSVRARGVRHTKALRERLTRFWMVPPLVLGMLGISSRDARAQSNDVKECIASVDRGQDERDHGKLIEAQEAFGVCSRSVCPKEIRSTCSTLLQSVQARVPSIIVVAKGPKGEDITSGTLTLDGKDASSALQGKAIPVNPGPHKLRMEAAGQVGEMDFVAREGQKSRAVEIALKPAGEADKSREGDKTKDDTKDGKDEKGLPGGRVAALVLGGVGIVSLGTGIVFDRVANGQFNDVAESPCGKTKTCSSDAFSSFNTSRTLGFLTLGIGAAALVTGVVLWFVSGGSTSKSDASSAKRLQTAWTF